MKNDKNFIHTSFDIALVLKGLDALAEIICGIALYFLSPETLNRMIAIVSGKELAEDPTDIIMNYLVAYGQTFTITSLKLGMIFLLTHGIVKMVMILLLWNQKMWAFPFSIIAFAAFVVFQTYHLIGSFSIMLLALTILDILVIILTILEYRRIKNSYSNTNKYTRLKYSR